MRIRHGLIYLAMLAWASTAGAQQGVRWQANLDTARKLAAQTNRLVLVHFWTESCQPCMKMERDVFSRSEVAMAVEANYVPVKVNVRQYPTTAQQFNVDAWPTDVVLTPQGQVVDRNTGYLDAPQYVGRLDQVAARARGQAPMMAAQPGPAAPQGQPTPGYGGQPAPSYAGGAAPVGRPPQGYASPPWQQNNGYPPASGPGSPAGAPSGPPAMAAAPPRQYGPPSGAQPPVQAAPAAPVPQGPVADRSYAGPGGPAAGPSPNGAYGQGPSGAMTGPSTPAAPAPSANPPLAMDGFCAVTLTEKERWVRGNPRFGVIHEGRTYLFAGPDEARKFYDDPERFAPANNGNDLVMQIEQGQSVPGRREHGAWYEGRVYLFSTEATYLKFSQEPARYLGQGPTSTARRPDMPGPAGAPAQNPPDQPGSVPAAQAWNQPAAAY